MNRTTSYARRAILTVLPFLLVLLAGCPEEREAPPPVTPSTLEAPAYGHGFQFRTPLFSVAAGTEVQDCYFFRVRDLARQGGLPDDEPVHLHRVRIVQRRGSHHMNLFRVRTVLGLDPEKGSISRGLNGQGECFKSSNWSDWPLIANSQLDGDEDWTFPEGVVNTFQPDEWIMLQTHYVNASSQRTPDDAEVAINWYTVPKEKVQHEMGTLFATKQSIRICKSNPSPEFTGTCQFKNRSQSVHVIGANAHFHDRGKRFDMYAWDGVSIAKPGDDARFYRSETWSDPPMARSPELSLEIEPGGGIFFSCAYQWRPPPEEAGGCKALDDADGSADKDCCYTFGPIVETNEHCNIFVYYWPRQESGDVFCN